MSSVEPCGSRGEREISRPLTIRTPVPGSAASLDRASSPARPQPAARPGGPTRTRPQTAPAATDVVCSGGTAVLMVTLSPASARQIPVVRPMTPAPITRTSIPRPYLASNAGDDRDDDGNDGHDDRDGDDSD